RARGPAGRRRAGGLVVRGGRQPARCDHLGPGRRDGPGGRARPARHPRTAPAGTRGTPCRPARPRRYGGASRERPAMRRTLLLGIFLPVVVFETGIGAILPIIALSAVDHGSSLAGAGVIVA